MNCLAGAFQMAGTVITQRTSSLTMIVADWEESSLRACSLKYRRAKANSCRAGNSCPLLDRIVVSEFSSWNKSTECQTTTRQQGKTSAFMSTAGGSGCKTLALFNRSHGIDPPRSVLVCCKIQLLQGLTQKGSLYRRLSPSRFDFFVLGQWRIIPPSLLEI